jgi:hypothetical protein
VVEDFIGKDRKTMLNNRNISDGNFHCFHHLFVTFVLLSGFCGCKYSQKSLDNVMLNPSAFAIASSPSVNGRPIRLIYSVCWEKLRLMGFSGYQPDD